MKLPMANAGRGKIRTTESPAARNFHSIGHLLIKAQRSSAVRLPSRRRWPDPLDPALRYSFLEMRHVGVASIHRARTVRRNFLDPCVSANSRARSVPAMMVESISQGAPQPASHDLGGCVERYLILPRETKSCVHRRHGALQHCPLLDAGTFWRKLQGYASVWWPCPRPSR